MFRRTSCSLFFMEQEVAIWVWQSKKSVTAGEIAEQFDISIYQARVIIHALMRRCDGLRAALITKSSCVNGTFRPVKYLTVYELPYDLDVISVSLGVNRSD